MTIDSLWIRRYHRASENAIGLVCFPHAGGSASFYLPVSRALTPTTDVLAVQYPGRQDRRAEQCIDDVRTLAQHAAEALGDYTRRPLALFGHSLGASVAFETARVLEHQQGRAPAYLFVTGRRAPSRQRDERAHLQDDSGLIEELRRLDGTESNVLGDDEMLRAVLPAVRSDYRAAETYRYEPGPPLSCPITVLISDTDPKVTLDEAQAWSEHTSGVFECRVFTGGHFFITQHQAELLDIIVSRLSTAVHPTIRL